MNIAFYDTDPRDEKGMREFMDLNDMAHTQIHDALLDQAIVTPKYNLRYPEITRDFLQLNQVELAAWGVALNVSAPVGLNDVDPKDPGQMEDWLQVQQLYVSQVATLLNL